MKGIEMSLITQSTAQAHDYAYAKLTENPSLILVIFTDGVELVVAPIDSDAPSPYHKVVGTFYWDDGIDFVGVTLLP